MLYSNSPFRNCSIVDLSLTVDKNGVSWGVITYSSFITSCAKYQAEITCNTTAGQFFDVAAPKFKEDYGSDLNFSQNNYTGSTLMQWGLILEDIAKSYEGFLNELYSNNNYSSISIDFAQPLQMDGMHFTW